MSVASLSAYQFGAGRGGVNKDPLSDKRKPSFGGASGAKTMQVDRGKGLPRPQTRHRHRKHAAARTRRAR